MGSDQKPPKCSMNGSEILDVLNQLASSTVLRKHTTWGGGGPSAEGEGMEVGERSKEDCFLFLGTQKSGHLNKFKRTSLSLFKKTAFPQGGGGERSKPFNKHYQVTL